MALISKFEDVTVTYVLCHAKELPPSRYRIIRFSNDVFRLYRVSFK